MTDTYDKESQGHDGRIRRSTIERFNDELAVLDRPLEGEAEYYDDPPRRSPWRRVGMIAGAALLLGGSGAFALARVSSTTSEGADRPKLAVALPPAAAVSAAAVIPAPPPARVVQPAEAPPTTVAEATAPEAETEPEVAPSADVGPWRLQPSRRAWANIRPAAPTSKHASATAHKSRHHGRHR
jgi:hypothetical protein